MNAAGIIVEYNPLHNGHLYHIKKTREITGCDILIAVMSGSFVQRGEPAFIDKFTRCSLALHSGVDLVLELPLLYSISSAEGFAFGGVSLLNSTGITSSICFGSESGSIEELSFIADILIKEPEEYRRLLKSLIKTGVSFPSAREKAIKEYASILGYPIGDILSSSNNILSIEYLKALKKTLSTIKPYTIKRIGGCYNQDSLEGSISSATAIRKNITNSYVKDSLPEYVYSSLLSLSQQGKGPVSMGDLSDIVLFTLRSKSHSQLSELLDVGEGLEYRIKRAAQDCGDIYQLIDQVKNKRYPVTRIQRILLYALFNITKEAGLMVKTPPTYMRVLGFNDKGREAISLIRSQASIPVITNPSPKDEELMRYDFMATDLYSLCFKNPSFKAARGDLKTPPVII
jgi:predicted nucleotidyltransferase